MPVVLGSNISSLSIQRQLGSASSELSKVFERLSSGQRINRASDDAAGLAIADTLQADQRVYTQGIRNLNDGLSILNVADGAISELTNITTRLSELAEQSSNGVFSNQQRIALDDEAQALSDEFLRIIQSTKFNGRQILSGDYGVLNLQAGYGSDARLGDGLGGAVGNGSFGTIELTALLGINFQEGELVDINGDGNLDAVGAASGSQVQILLGDGNGSFSSPTTLDSSDPRDQVAVSDFNNDGYHDIASTNTAGGLEIFLGNGSGSFSSVGTYGGVYEATSDLVIGDVNGDGVMDIVTSGHNVYEKYVHIRIGNGDGTFQAATSFLQHSGSNENGGLDLGDVNGDGTLDIVSGRTNDDFGGGFVNVYLNSGSGTFTSSATINLGSFTYDSAFADVNQDGNLDVIATAASSTHIYLGDGTGSFTLDATYSTPSGRSITTGDINGDGVLDLGISQSSSYITFTGTGDGTFESRFVSGIGTAMGTGGMHFADITNDGVLDIFSFGSQRIGTVIGESVDGVAPLLEFSLRTAAEAREALSLFSHKLDHLTTQRGQIGAFQSRVGVAENVLRVTTENYSAAESRIRDTDIAQESSALVRLNILQQAGAAVLAQANIQPQIALQLLSG